jgi:hypothetical protein
MIAKLIDSFGPGKGGRKVNALDKALGVLMLLAVGAGYDGISENELDSLLMGLAGILATFTGGNAAEHYTKKGKKEEPPAEGG